MGVGQNIRKLRTQQNKSQQEVADQLQIDRRTYISWENGTTDIKSQYIPQLANIFDVEINDLYKDHSPKIEIIQNHNEGKDSSLLNGAVIIVTDKQSIQEIVEIIKDRMNTSEN